MQATISARWPETADGTIQTLQFTASQPLHYSPGQFIELTIPHSSDERGQMRWFTLSSSPYQAQTAVTVNFANSRSSYKAALQQLQIGDSIHVSEPLGDFVLPLDTAIPLVWVAVGVGITPFISMVRQMQHDQESRHITLIHQAGGDRHSLFRPEWRPLLSGYHPLDSSSAGGSPSTNELLQKTLQSATHGAAIYIAGPEALVGRLRDELNHHDIPKERIVTDAFLGY